MFSKIYIYKYNWALSSWKIYDPTVLLCCKLKISKAKNHAGRKFCANGKGVGLRLGRAVLSPSRLRASPSWPPVRGEHFPRRFRALGTHQTGWHGNLCFPLTAVLLTQAGGACRAWAITFKKFKSERNFLGLGCWLTIFLQVYFGKWTSMTLFLIHCQK